MSSILHPRGPAEWLTLPVGIVNFLFKTLLIFLAQGAQVIGGILSNPFHKVWDNFKKERTFTNTVKLLRSLPFWAIAQTFYYIGNTLSYAILVVDSIANFITTGLGWLIRDKTKYEESYGQSLKTLVKNLALLIPAAIISVMTLVPGFQFLPALASSLAAIVLPSIKIAATIAITVATGLVAQLYLKTMEKLESYKDRFISWAEKKLRPPEEPAYSFDERKDFDITEKLTDEQERLLNSKPHKHVYYIKKNRLLTN